MSYRLSRPLGQIDLSASALRQVQAKASTTVSRTSASSPAERFQSLVPNSPGFSLAPTSVREAATINVPAKCGNLPSLIEGVQYPVAGSKLIHGRLYVAVFPLVRKLSSSQKATVEQEFIRRLNPTAADYSVKMRTPCDLGARRSEACQCRDRKNPASWNPHQNGHVGESMDVQRCLSGEEKDAARAAISFYHQLWPSQELPFGYREVSGLPVFVYPVALNPDPRTALLNSDGTVKSGNLKTTPPQYPQISRARVASLAYGALGQAMTAAGLRRSDVSPGTLFEINRWDATPLAEAMDRFARAKTAIQDAGADKPRTKEPDTVDQIARDFTWDWDAYLKGKRKVAKNPQSAHPDAEYYRVANLAIEQATAAGRDAVMVVWQTIAGIFALALTASGTDSFARGVSTRAFWRTKAFERGSLAVVQSGTVEANVNTMGPQLLANPNPMAAYAIIKELRKAFQQSIQEIRQAQTALPQGPQYIAEVFDGVQRTGVEIKERLQTKVAQLKARTPSLDEALRTRLECKLYAKAKSEQQKWPRRLLDRVPPLQQAIQAYAGVHAQSNEAINRYQAAMAKLDEIEDQLNLAWWQKDLGPLPVWGWGAIGMGVFIGGAFYLRSRRRKKAPKPNRRRTSRRALRA